MIVLDGIVFIESEIVPDEVDSYVLRDVID